MNRKTHNDLALLLIGGARGDLKFDRNGDVRYMDYVQRNREGVDLLRKQGELLIKVVSSEGPGYHFELTPDGAVFILENLQGCYTAHQGRELVKFHDDARRAARSKVSA